MNFALKSLVAAAAIASLGAANAASVTTSVGGTNSLNGQALTLTGGTGTLSFSDSLIAALNVGKVAVTAVSPATVHEENGTVDGTVVRVLSEASAPIQSVTADNVSGTVLSVATVGGALQTAPVTSQVSRGGTLAVTNLNVDIANKRIYASITGDFTGAATGVPGTATGGAVTTIDNFYLWDFASISGPTTITGPGTFQNVISGLTITTDGFNHFVSALRLLSTGKSALRGVNDDGGYGTITSSITVTSVPEPSTYALMGLGLVGIGLAARRRAK